MRTKSYFVAFILTAASICLGESAHKGWSAYPDTPSHRITNVAVQVSMSGSIVDIRKPDPEPDCQFKGWISAGVKDKVSLQRIYLLSVDASGQLESRDVTFELIRSNVTGVVRGKHGIEFSTAKTAFRKGDIFAIVLDVNGFQTVSFSRIVFRNFVPH